MKIIKFVRDMVQEFWPLFLWFIGWMGPTIVFESASYAILYVAFSFMAGCVGETYRLWSKEQPKELMVCTKPTKCAESEKQ